MKGPENADQAQLEILRKIQRRTNIDYEFSEDDLDRSQGQLSWGEIEDLFSDEALQEFSQGKTGSKQQEKVPVFRALDQIYDSLKTTYSGNPKLEGIRSIKIGWDPPVSENSFRHWRKSYDKAGLITDSGPEPELTDEGEYFYDTFFTDKEPQYDISMDTDTIGEVFSDLMTQGYGDSEEYTGKKIEAFLLYGTGLGHRSISEGVGISESTLRGAFFPSDENKTSFDQHGYGLLESRTEDDVQNPDTANYTFTKKGREFGKMILHQAEKIRELTQQRLKDDTQPYDDFGGNKLMAEQLVQEY